MAAADTTAADDPRNCLLEKLFIDVFRLCRLVAIRDKSHFGQTETWKNIFHQNVTTPQLDVTGIKISGSDNNDHIEWSQYEYSLTTVADR